MFEESQAARDFIAFFGEGVGQSRWRFTSPLFQGCDLEEADQGLPDFRADTLLADKGYDASERLNAEGQTSVILPRLSG